MDQQLLQRTRYLLQTRFRRIRTAHAGNFEIVCKQVLDWVEKHPILSSLIRHLDNVPGEHHEEVKRLVESNMGSARYYSLIFEKDQRQEHERSFVGYTPANLEEHTSACLQILRATIKKPALEFYNLLAVYLTSEAYDFRHNKDQLEAIKDIAVHHLHEYLDEQLDGINAVNGLLQKYKQNVEWFELEDIQRIVREGYGGKTGERALSHHLQHYIFEQGVDFVVEPSSASGEVDLLLRDASGQYTVIDAKYIKPDETPSDITRRLAEGFNQVARYCNDYNQPEGFLAVFVNDDISINLDVDYNDSFRYLKIGAFVIYYIDINISERPSASKAGKGKQITIARDRLIGEIEEIQKEMNN